MLCHSMKNVQTFLFCFTVTYTLASDCKIADRTNHLTGYRIEHGVFKTIESIGITGCQNTCIKTAACQSVSYNTDTLVCSLGHYLDSKTFTGLKTDIFIRPNTSDDTFKRIGSCKNRPCAVTETCVHLSSGNFSCITSFRPIDLAVLIDGSRSLSEDDFYDVVNCTKYLVNVMIDMRLAVTIFNTYITTPLYFDQFSNKSDMPSVIDDNLVYPNQVGNKLGQALLEVYNNVFSSSRGNRANVKNVVLVVLNPNDMETANLDNSDTMKSAGISIVTVAIASTTVGIGILQQVTSDPFEDYNLNIDSAGNLPQIYETIVDTINNIP